MCSTYVFKHYQKWNISYWLWKRCECVRVCVCHCSSWHSVWWWSELLFAFVWHMVIKITIFPQFVHHPTLILFVRIGMFSFLSKSCVHLTIHNHNPFLLTKQNTLRRIDTHTHIALCGRSFSYVCLASQSLFSSLLLSLFVFGCATKVYRQRWRRRLLLRRIFIVTMKLPNGLTN